jgi:hypothetical protein
MVVRESFDRHGLPEHAPSEDEVSSLVPYISHHSLDFDLRISGKWQEGQARLAAEIAIKIHPVLDAGNAELSHDAF